MAGTAAQAAAWFAALRRDVAETTDASITASLAELILRLETVTPVVSGRMRADYTIATSAVGYYELLDTAQSPGGYDYPARVLFDPTWSRQYDALQAVLDGAEDAIAADLDRALARLAARP